MLLLITLLQILIITLFYHCQIFCIVPDVHSNVKFLRKMRMLQRKDPEQFMQIHGRKCQIHMDPAVARAAEASSILCAFNISNLLVFCIKHASHHGFLSFDFLR